MNNFCSHVFAMQDVVTIRIQSACRRPTELVVQAMFFLLLLYGTTYACLLCVVCIDLPTYLII